MKTFLIPIDFSRNCDNLISYAIELTKNEHAKIFFVHDFKIIDDNFFEAGTKNKSYITAREICMGFCDRIISVRSNLECDFINRKGRASEVVLSVAKEKNIDIILIEMPKDNGSLISNSHANVIIDDSRHSTLIIPQKVLFQEFHKISYVTNYYESDISSLQKVVSLAKSLRSHLEIIHVCDGEYNNYSEKWALKMFEKIINSRIRYKEMSYRLIKGEDEEERLAQFGNKKNTDLLAISVHQRRMLEKFFFKSMVKKLAHEIKVPLFIIRHNEKERLLV